MLQVWKMGQFARECTEQKVHTKRLDSSFTYVTSSCVMLAESLSIWTVDSGAIDYITRDGAAFVDYHRLPRGSKYIYMGNDTKAEVFRIGTCKLEMRDLYLGITYYGTGRIMDGFMLLDTVNNKCNVNSNCFSYVASSSSNVSDDPITCHSRLGHIGKHRMNRLAREGLLGPVSIVSEPCLACKATRKHFHKNVEEQSSSKHPRISGNYPIERTSQVELDTTESQSAQVSIDKEYQKRKSKQGKIPHRRFDITRNSFLIDSKHHAESETFMVDTFDEECTDNAKITRNGQNRTNTDRGTDRVHKSRKILVKGHQKSTLGQPLVNS
ncbi:integrase [Tanacetum coccineum]